MPPPKPPRNDDDVEAGCPELIRRAMIAFHVNTPPGLNENLEEDDTVDDDSACSLSDNDDFDVGYYHVGLTLKKMKEITFIGTNAEIIIDTGANASTAPRRFLHEIKTLPRAMIIATSGSTHTPPRPDDPFSLTITEVGKLKIKLPSDETWEVENVMAIPFSTVILLPATTGILHWNPTEEYGNLLGPAGNVALRKGRLGLPVLTATVQVPIQTTPSVSYASVAAPSSATTERNRRHANREEVKSRAEPTIAPMTPAQRTAAQRVILENPGLLSNSEAMKLLQQQHDNLVHHQRFCHVHPERLKTMAKHNTILNMPASLRRTHMKLCQCASCLRAKIRRRNAPRVRRPLKLHKRRYHLSFDRSGKTQLSIDGFRYIVYAIDTVTKRVFAWPLQSKTEEEFLDVVINGDHGLVEILKFQMKAGEPAEVELELSSNHDEVLPPSQQSEAYSPSVRFKPMPMDATLHDLTLNGEQSQPGHPQRKLRTDGENTFLTSHGGLHL